MKTAGIILAFAGIVLTVYSLFGFETSVSSGSNSVNNIGLLFGQLNLTVIGMSFFISGSVFQAIGFLKAGKTAPAPEK